MLNRILFFILTMALVLWDFLIFNVDHQEFLDTGKIRLILTAAFLALGLELWKRIHPAIACFTALLALHTVWFAYFPNWQLTTTITIVGGLVIMAWAAKLSAAEGRILFRFMAYAVLLQAALGLLNTFGFYLTELKLSWLAKLPMGTIGHPTVLGPLVVAFIPYFVMVERRVWLATLGALLLTYVALMTKSTGTYGALIALLVAFYAWRSADSPRLMVNAALVAILFAGAFVLAGFMLPDLHLFSSSGRMPWYRVAALGYTAFPYFGMGGGGWFIFAKQLADTAGLSPSFTFGELHSDWFQLAFEFGAAGLALGVWAQVAFLRALFSQTSAKGFAMAAPFLVVSANAVINMPFHRPSTALVAIISFAVTMSAHHRRDQIIRQ